MKVDVRHNSAQGGIEVVFSEKPDYTIISWLKSNGFRWAQFRKLWYARFSESLFSTTKEKFTGLPAVELTEEQKKLQARQKQEKEIAALKESYPAWAATNPDADRWGKLDIINFSLELPQTVRVPGLDVDNPFIWNSKKKAYEHLPRGRKRPDYYSIAVIHHKMQDAVIKHGGMIDFKNLYSNPQNSQFIRYQYDDLQRLIQNKPYLLNSEENKEYVREVEKKMDAYNFQVRKWNEYRQRVLADYAKEKKPLWAKNKDNIYGRVYIDYLSDEIIGSMNQAMVSVMDKSGGYIVFSLTRPLNDIFIEDPAANPQAKPITELFPPDSQTMPAQESSSDIEIEAEALALELELLNSESISGTIKQLNKQHPEKYVMVTYEYGEPVYVAPLIEGHVNVTPELAEAEVWSYADTLSSFKLKYYQSITRCKELKFEKKAALDGCSCNFGKLVTYDERGEDIIGMAHKELIRPPKARMLYNKKKGFTPFKITSSEHAAEIFRDIIGSQITVSEHAVMLILNRANNVVAYFKVSEGGIDSTTMDVRKIMAAAIGMLASAIIICHNHPTGNLTPSDPDRAVTLRIKAAAEAQQMKLLDHIIVSNESYYSFADNGII